MLIMFLYSWTRKSSNSSSFRRIYESRINYCARLAKDQMDGVFAPSIPVVSGSPPFRTDWQSNDGFFGWMTPAWNHMGIEVKSWKPGNRVIERQNEK